MITAEQIETAEKILELAEKYLFAESECILRLNSATFSEIQST